MSFCQLKNLDSFCSLLDNNRFLDTTSYDVYEPKVHPEFQGDEKQLKDVVSTTYHGSRSNVW